jgi:type VI secretion system protein ImpL
MVGDVPQEFDALIERLNDELTDRLQDEPSPNTRVLLFGFPSQMTALKKPVFDFLNQIFEPTRYHANATLRGFYFTSGTQEGTPIDRLIGALAKTFGAEEAATSAYSGQGKSFFLTDLIRKVIIGEAAWVSTNRAAVRRGRIIKIASYAAITLVTVALAGLWWTSYVRNKELVAQTDAAIADYRTAAGSLLAETIIRDRDFAKVLPLLHRLRYLPAGYANRMTPLPLLAGFGLSQRARLQTSSENAYRVGLERMFRTRLIYRMEELLEANRADASFIYEALKVYMMLGGLQPPDRNLILAWWRRDWADNLYPGAANDEGRKELGEHLAALLDLDTGQDPLITLNGPLIDECQKTLARLSVAQRAYELLKSQARANSELDWVASRHGGIDFATVFETTNGDSLDNVRVPAFFTYLGFHRMFIDRLGDIAEQIKRERWVLGPAGEQSAISVQYDTLGPNLLGLYTKDFIAAWQAALAKLQLRRLTADKPKYVALIAVSSQTSPLKQLLESIRDETALTRERPAAPAKPGEKPAPAPAPKASSPTLLKQQGQAPGADIETAFKGFHVLVEGDASRRPLDAVLANLGDIYQSLNLLATNPAQAAQANSALQLQVASLRANANRFPQPFQNMLAKAAGSFEGDLTNSTHGQLQRALGDQVTGVCNQIVPNRYPFTRGTEREVPLAEFGKLFAPNGIPDQFYTQHLATMVDTSRPEWRWRQDQPLARALSPATLREFQRAQQIKDAFFSTGGNMPSVNLNVIAPWLGPDVIVKLEVNGTTIESKPGNSSAVALQWPGAGGYRTAVTVTGTFFGAPSGTPSVLERHGNWSLFRLIDAGSPVKRGDRVIASFIVGGRELQYQFAGGSVQNPLTLAALREFRCPNGI